MPRSRTKKPVRRVLRPGNQRFKAVQAASAVITEILDFVKTFLIEAQGPLGTGDFKPQLHFMARGDPVGLDMATATAGKPQGQTRNVVNLYRYQHPRTRAFRPSFNHRIERGEHFAYRAEQKSGHTQNMAAQIRHRAGPSGRI
ncbi:hypothetical protein D3C71_1650300 [compost metagenome]